MRFLKKLTVFHICGKLKPDNGELIVEKRIFGNGKCKRFQELPT